MPYSGPPIFQLGKHVVGEDETQSAWQLAVLSQDLCRVKHIAVRYVFVKVGNVMAD
jgi:hypothetical protein